MKISFRAHWETERSFIDKFGRPEQYYLLYYDWQKQYLPTPCTFRHCGQCGPTWEGGLNASLRRTPEYKLWRNLVRERDHYCCTECGSVTRIEVDHFPMSFAQLLKNYKIDSIEQALATPELWEVGNGRVLCHNCHMGTPSYLTPLSQHPFITNQVLPNKVDNQNEGDFVTTGYSFA